MRRYNTWTIRSRDLLFVMIRYNKVESGSQRHANKIQEIKKHKLKSFRGKGMKNPLFQIGDV